MSEAIKMGTILPLSHRIGFADHQPKQSQMMVERKTQYSYEEGVRVRILSHEQQFHMV